MILESIDSCFEVWKNNINKLVKAHPLHIISWEATRRCNLKCQHCGSPSESVNLDEELTADEVISAFKQIAVDFDMSKFRHINITGGEPFVRKDLLKILESFYVFPFYRNIDIQTNGIYIANNPEILEEIKKFGVTGLGISIDGLEKTHDVFRARQGSFKKAFKAARLSVEKGYIVTVSVVAHAKNICEIPTLYELVKKEIKPRVFRIMTIDPIGRAEYDKILLLNHEQIKFVIHFLQTEYQKNCTNYANPDTTMVELGCGGWFGKELEGTFRPMIFHCIAGINNLGILHDGKLASCSNIPREFIQGDLRKDRIKEIWENKYQKYRNFEWRKTKKCNNCKEWDYCHGGPMHLYKIDKNLSLFCRYTYGRNQN